MRILLLVLALLSISCRPSGPVDVAFVGSDLELSDALRAADAWNSTCGFELVTVHRGGSGIDMRGVDGPVDGVENRAGQVYRDELGEPVRIRFDRTTEYSLVAIMAHEFGHALGLPHVDYGLMRPVIDLEGDGPLPAGYISPEQCAAVM